MYDKRNKLSGEVEREARDYFKEKVYQTIVPRNVRLSEAPHTECQFYFMINRALEANPILVLRMNLLIKIK